MFIREFLFPISFWCYFQASTTSAWLLSHVEVQNFCFYYEQKINFIVIVTPCQKILALFIYLCIELSIREWVNGNIQSLLEFKLYESHSLFLQIWQLQTLSLSESSKFNFWDCVICVILTQPSWDFAFLIMHLHWFWVSLSLSLSQSWVWFLE